MGLRRVQEVHVYKELSMYACMYVSMYVCTVCEPPLSQY